MISAQNAAIVILFVIIDISEVKLPGMAKQIIYLPNWLRGGGGCILDKLLCSWKMLTQQNCSSSGLHFPVTQSHENIHCIDLFAIWFHQLYQTNLSKWKKSSFFRFVKLQVWVILLSLVKRSTNSNTWDIRTYRSSQVSTYTDGSFFDPA
jgi:hypothetical protein